MWFVLFPGTFCELLKYYGETGLSRELQAKVSTICFNFICYLAAGDSSHFLQCCFIGGQLLPKFALSQFQIKCEKIFCQRLTFHYLTKYSSLHQKSVCLAKIFKHVTIFKTVEIGNEYSRYENTFIIIFLAVSVVMQDILI